MFAALQNNDFASWITAPLPPRWPQRADRRSISLEASGPHLTECAIVPGPSASLIAPSGSGRGIFPASAACNSIRIG